MSRRSSHQIVGWVSEARGCSAFPSRYAKVVPKPSPIVGSAPPYTCRFVAVPEEKFCPRHQFLLEHAAEIQANKRAANHDADYAGARRSA